MIMKDKDDYTIVKAPYNFQLTLVKQSCHGTDSDPTTLHISPIIIQGTGTLWCNGGNVQ